MCIHVYNMANNEFIYTMRCVMWAKLYDIRMLRVICSLWFFVVVAAIAKRLPSQHLRLKHLPVPCLGFNISAHFKYNGKKMLSCI